MWTYVESWRTCANTSNLSENTEELQAAADCLCSYLAGVGRRAHILARVRLERRAVVPCHVLAMPPQGQQADQHLFHVGRLEEIAGLKVLMLGHAQLSRAVRERLDILTHREGHRALLDLGHGARVDRIQQRAEHHAALQLEAQIVRLGR